jgi:hypothetical protein
MDEVEPLRRVFARYVASERLESPVGAIAELVAKDELSRDAVDRVLAEYNVTVSGTFRDGLLDLILDTVRISLQDHRLTAPEQQFFRELKGYLRIPEGAFYKHRRGEVTELLSAQVRRMIDDGLVDLDESLLQVELQRLFDLGYDQYLELTREPATRLIDGLIHHITSDGRLTMSEIDALEGQLKALDRVYTFTHQQRLALNRAMRRS